MPAYGVRYLLVDGCVLNSLYGKSHGVEQYLFSGANPAVRVHALLLECNGWGKGWYSQH